MSQLYLITPSKFHLPEMVEKLKLALSGGQVACVQLRMKPEDYTQSEEIRDKSRESEPVSEPSLVPRSSIAPQHVRGDIASHKHRIREAARALLPIVHDHGAQFILNDYPELVPELGADGVHLGDEDITAAEARQIVGEEKLIGISCYASKDRAFTAGEQGADYVAFGQFYHTKTKPPKGHPTPELLEFWRDFATIPCVAIGGITPKNLAPLVKAGADFIAVVSGVWEHPEGAKAAVQEYLHAIDVARDN